MKKKSLFLVVALLALSGLMAVMAYSNAHVTNKTLAAVVETDNAWLAIVENPDFTDFAKINAAGVMEIDFAGLHGFQPGSTYYFKELFRIENNLDKNVEVGLRFANCYPHIPHTWIPGLRQITAGNGSISSASGELLFASSAAQFTRGWNEGLRITLAPGESIPINWQFIVSGNQALGSGNWTLEVHSNAIGR